MILGISEDVFWYADVSFVESIALNKSAYDGWLGYVREREAKQKKTS